MTNIERSLVNIAQVLVRSKAVTVRHAAPFAMLWSAPQPLSRLRPGGGQCHRRIVPAIQYRERNGVNERRHRVQPPT
jgi:hypothetical protein